MIKKIMIGIVLGVITSVAFIAILERASFIEIPVGSTADQIADKPTKEVIQQVILNQEDAQIEAIERVAGAIVGVVNFVRERQRGEGSGIVYKVEDGHTYIVTNEHVIAGGDYFEVVFDNETNDRVAAELVGSDVYTDLAVLRIRNYEAKVTAAFGNTEDLRIGQTVIAIGNPLGLEFAGSATSGIVSGHNRTVNVNVTSNNRAQVWQMTVLQTDTAINPGNSGGALINLSGEVVGINSMKIASGSIEGMSFSIPTYVALPIISDLEMFGEVIRPTLGVSLLNMNQIPDIMKENIGIPLNQRSGVYVNEVVRDSLAEYMGIRSGDVITAIGAVEIANSLTFRKELFKYREGDELTITVLRKGESVQLTAEIFITP